MSDRYLPPLIRAAVLPLLALFILAGCGKQAAVNMDSIDESVAGERALVIEHVTDPDTREQVLALIDEDEARMRKFFVVRDSYQEKIQALNARYDVSRTELEAELQEYNEALRQVVVQVLENRSKVRTLVSPEQWEKITAGKAGYLDN